MSRIWFTVVIPLYNKENYIQRTIDSVLNQTYQNFEIFIVNDGSTDESLKKVKEINSDKIRIIDQANQGVSIARNNGIKEGNFNWIALLDGDDEFRPNYLENLKLAIDKDSNYIAYASSFEKRNINNVIFTPKFRFLPVHSGILKNYFKSTLLGEQCISSSSICLNRKLLKENSLLELFPRGIKRGEDLDAWTKLALNNRIYFINEPLVLINNVIDNVSNKNFNYRETFPYDKWNNYRIHDFSYKKKIYLKALLVKRKLHVSKKLFRAREFRSLIVYMVNPQ